MNRLERTVQWWRTRTLNRAGDPHLEPWLLFQDLRRLPNTLNPGCLNRPITEKGAQKWEVYNHIRRDHDGAFAGRFALVSTDDFERLQNLERDRPIDHDDDEGLARYTHFLWWPLGGPDIDGMPVSPGQGLLAVEARRGLPTVRRLEAYIQSRHLNGWRMEFTPIVSADNIHRLRDEVIVEMAGKLPANQVDLDAIGMPGVERTSQVVWTVHATEKAQLGLKFTDRALAWARGVLGKPAEQKGLRFKRSDGTTFTLEELLVRSKIMPVKQNTEKSVDQESVLYELRAATNRQRGDLLQILRIDWRGGDDDGMEPAEDE